MNTTLLKRWFGVLLPLLLLIESAHAFYNPEVGRWLNRDPIGEEGGINLYAFAANDPVGNMDFLGHLFWGCSKKPEPPPNDPDDCWKSSNKYKLPVPGAGKQAACLARKTGCLQCCEDKHPIKGGDPTKYAECVAGCEDNYKRCAGLDTTKPR